MFSVLRPNTTVSGNRIKITLSYILPNDEYTETSLLDPYPAKMATNGNINATCFGKSKVLPIECSCWRFFKNSVLCPSGSKNIFVKQNHISNQQMITCWESICKADQALGEVVHGEPGHDLPELHAGPPRDVYDEVAQVLPVTHHVHRAGPHLRVLTRHTDTRGKTTI